MKSTFAYNRFNDERADALVESLVELSSMYSAGKANTEDYKEKNATFNHAIAKYAVETSGMEFSGLEMLKNPMTIYSLDTRRFETILAQSITPAIPQYASDRFANLYDVIQVGWGDIPKFEVESNEALYVYDLAGGILRGTQVTDYATEYTIPTRQKSVSIQCDWYKVACGVFDWGKLVAKIGQAYEHYLNIAAINAMLKVVNNGASYGIAGYQFASFTDANWAKCRQLVSAANGGADVYALGTYGALVHVMPMDSGSLLEQFRITEDGPIVKDGMLPMYKRVPLMEIEQSIDPHSVNGSSPKLLVPDDKIFMLPVGGYRPIKMVFEGNGVTVTKDPATSKDLTYGMTVNMYVGLGAVVGTKFGCITLQ